MELANIHMVGSILNTAFSRAKDTLPIAIQDLKCSAIGTSLLPVIGEGISKECKMAIGAVIVTLAYYNQPEIASAIAIGAILIDQYYRKETPSVEKSSNYVNTALTNPSATPWKDPCLQTENTNQQAHTNDSAPTELAPSLENTDSGHLSFLISWLANILSWIANLFGSFDNTNLSDLTNPNIYEKITIESYRNSYFSETKRNALNITSSQGVSHYRNVKGDGNCYYRAMMFGFLEQLINHPERATHLDNLIKKIRLSSMPDLAKTDLLQILQGMMQGTLIGSVEDLERLFSDEGQLSFDYNIILAARYLTSDYLIKNGTNPASDTDPMTLWGKIQLTDPAATKIDVETYCKNQVLKMEEYVDGCIPQDNLLGEILNFDTTLFDIPNQLHLKRDFFSENENPVRVKLIRTGVHFSLVY